MRWLSRLGREPGEKKVVTRDAIEIDPNMVGGEPDAALVARLKRLEAEAFEQVLERYRPAVFSFLLRLSANRALAEDLLQETWVRLANSASQLADDTNLRAWLFTVARNLHASHRRWTLIDEQRLRDLHLWPGGRQATPFEQAAATEAERKAESALASLPTKYREVLLLVAVQKMEPAEAAGVLGIRPEALRQRLARARGMMAEHMGLEAAES